MRTPSQPFCETLEKRALLSAAPNDPSYANSALYGLSRVAAGSAWSITTGSVNTLVANIDSGVDIAHPDLYLNIYLNQGEIPFPGIVESSTDGDTLVTFHDLNVRNADGSLLNGAFVSDLNRNGYIDGEDLVFDRRWSNGVDNDRNSYVDDIVGWDFANNDNDPYDFHGHGTHTAGTIGAIGNNNLGIVGMNWNVRIIPLKVFSDNGDGAGDQAIANAIYYAVNQGARVSNNSYGGSFGYKGDLLYNAISYANQRGHLFVAASGNEGINNDSSQMRSYPASYDLPNIISVAASNTSDQMVSYSNFGKRTVDIVAPGESVLSTLPGGYGRSSGTSMASPHVAGAAALLLSAQPNLAAWQVKYALMLSADKSNSLRYKVFSGGRLNVSRAITIATGFMPASASKVAAPTKAATPAATPARSARSVFNVDRLIQADDMLPRAINSALL